MEVYEHVTGNTVIMLATSQKSNLPSFPLSLSLSLSLPPLSLSASEIVRSTLFLSIFGVAATVSLSATKLMHSSSVALFANYITGAHEL